MESCKEKIIKAILEKIYEEIDSMPEMLSSVFADNLEMLENAVLTFKELAKEYGIKLYDDKFVIYKSQSGNYGFDYKKRWDYDHINKGLYTFVKEIK